MLQLQTGKQGFCQVYNIGMWTYRGAFHSKECHFFRDVGAKSCLVSVLPKICDLHLQTQLPIVSKGNTLGISERELISKILIYF